MSGSASGVSSGKNSARRTWPDIFAIYEVKGSSSFSAELQGNRRIVNRNSKLLTQVLVVVDWPAWPGSVEELFIISIFLNNKVYNTDISSDSLSNLVALYLKEVVILK